MANYDINYQDKRFTEVETDKREALSEVEKTYGGMINQADKYYQKQIDASKQWAETQKKNQQAQSDFAIEQIEQQKDQAEKDYTKEQSGAYTDWQKEKNSYGVNAEEAAAQGMQGGGYSESAQVSLYNTYQNRVMAAREAYSRAVLNYDNAIKDARLQNNSALAEIAYNSLQKQLELSLEGFQYKNQLITAKADKKMAVDEMYYGRYQDVLKQINTENTLAEEVRQYNESMKFQKEKAAQDRAIQQSQLALEREKFAWQKAQANKASSGGGSSRKSSSKKSSSKKSSGSSTIKKSSGSSIKKSSSSKSNVSVDMNSVLSLGYGPISASKLNSLVNQGIVQEYQSGNKLKYRKVIKR
jgi:hypothetical protein